MNRSQQKKRVGTLALFMLALLSLLLLVFLLVGLVAVPSSPDSQLLNGAKLELKLPLSQLHVYVISPPSTSSLSQKFIDRKSRSLTSRRERERAVRVSKVPGVDLWLFRIGNAPSIQHLFQHVQIRVVAVTLFVIWLPSSSWSSILSSKRNDDLGFVGCRSIRLAKEVFSAAFYSALDSCKNLTFLSNHCRHQGESGSKPWVEVLSWEPRAFLYHKFLVRVPEQLGFGIVILFLPAHNRCLFHEQHNA